MAKPISQIQAELNALATDIPAFIKTGIPANVKSDKHRSLEERSVIALQDLLEHIENFQQYGTAISGYENPNEMPPSADYGIAQLYIQKEAETEANLALWIYTDVDGQGWVMIRDQSTGIPTKYYGDVVNPNSEPIPNLPSVNPFKIGDYYVKTSTGTSSGDVQSVWIYLGLAVGDQWISLTAGTGGVSAFLGLTDAPSSYEGQAKKGVRVRADEEGLEFFASPEKVTDSPTGIHIDGDVRAKAFIGRATAHDTSTAFFIDANDLSEMYHLNLTGHTNIEITNRTNGLTGVVTAWAKGTYNLNFVNLVHEEDSSLGYDGTMWNLIVMEWSDTASYNIGTWKVVSQMPI